MQTGPEDNRTRKCLADRKRLQTHSPASQNCSSQWFRYVDDRCVKNLGKSKTFIDHINLVDQNIRFRRQRVELHIGPDYLNERIPSSQMVENVQR